MDPEFATRLYLEACFHLDIRTRLKGRAGKKDLPVMVESLKRIARGAGGGPFRPPTDSGLFKEVLREYLQRAGGRIDDEIFCDRSVAGLKELEPSVRRAFFNELSWFVFDNGLDGFGGEDLLKRVYTEAEIGRQSYSGYAAKFRPGGGADDSPVIRSAKRANLRLALVLLVIMAACGGVAWWYSFPAMEKERVVLPEQRMTYRTVRFFRTVAVGPIGGEDRSAGRTDLYVFSGTAEVWFDVSGLKLEQQGEDYRAVYTAGRGGDYVFAPVRVGVLPDTDGLRASMSVVLGAGSDRARVEPLGFLSERGGGWYRTAVSREEGVPPLSRFSGALADAAPLFGFKDGPGAGTGWAASGGMAAGLSGTDTPLPERLDAAARRLIAAQILFSLPPAETLRATFEAGVTAQYGASGKKITTFEYREAGS